MEVGENKVKAQEEVRAALFKAASAYTDYTLYKADMIEKYSAPDDMIAEMWKAGKRTFSEIAADSGLSADALGRKYGVPYGTVNRWRSVKGPPTHILYMLQICEGLIKQEVQR